MSREPPPIHPVILAGGGGTRLWPLSRAEHPKQFMPLAGAHPLLGETLARVGDRTRFAEPLVVCNEAHRFLVAEALRAAGGGGEIVLEPCGRNTAPAACLAALRLAAREPAALMLLLPADHLIARPEELTAAIARAAPVARDGRIVTFGIAPGRAETGYGYIRQGAALAAAPGCREVAAFVEKPDTATAEAYLAAGDYLWNSGIFLAPARVLLDELQRLQPAVLAACREALAGARADLDFLRPAAAPFEACPAISLDRGVMEHTAHAAVVPADPGWHDIGAWDELWSVLDKDAAGNAVVGDVVAVDSRGSLLHGDGRLLAALGVSDLVVVASEDAVLVCPRERAQDVGRLVGELARRGRAEARAHSRVVRPWGSYRCVDRDAMFKVKRLIVTPGRKLSLQRHRHRTEHWVVVEGEAEVTCDGHTFRLRANQSTYIPCGAVHRLANPGREPLHVIEVQSGDYLEEDDIERFPDPGAPGGRP